MKNVLTTFIVLIICFSNFQIQAQNNKCGFDYRIESQKDDPIFQRSRAQFENFVRQYANQAAERSNGSSSTPVIPCVVHILHTGQALGELETETVMDGDGNPVEQARGANPTDIQVISAIDDMNAAFAQTGYYAEPERNGYYDAAPDMQFVLAKTDPDGNPTNGIMRYDVSNDPDFTAANFRVNGMKGLDPDNQPGVAHPVAAQNRIWPPTDYINIWLVHVFAAGESGLLGYAAFPESGGGLEDGLALLTTAFGRAPDPENPTADFILGDVTIYNSTLSHEMGHYLNLYHSFEGSIDGNCPPVDDGCGSGQGDCCDDIPAHIGSSGCDDFDAEGNTCPFDGPTSNAHIYNFMDYSDDVCFHGFSEDQATRMEATIAGPRRGLTTSIGGIAPSGIYPSPLATDPIMPNPDGQSDDIGVKEISLEGVIIASSASWYDGGYVNRTASQPTIDLNTSTTYTIDVKVGFSASSAHQLAGVFIDYNNDGDFDDAGEEIGTIDPGTATAGIETHSFTFTTPAAPNPVTGQRIRMRVVADWDNDFTPINANEITHGGQIEDYSVRLTAVLPVELTRFKADLINKNNAQLTWQTETETNHKGFEIQRSIDGKTFEKVGFVSGNGTSNTVIRYEFMDKQLAENTYYYRLKQIDFDNKAEYSNIETIVVKSQKPIRTYPNPATDFLHVDFEADITPTLFLSNALGQQINVPISLNNQQITLDLSLLPSGVYFLHEAEAGFVSKFVKR